MPVGVEALWLQTHSSQLCQTTIVPMLSQAAMCKQLVSEWILWLTFRARCTLMANGCTRERYIVAILTADSSKGGDVSLHSFPSDKKRRKKWENACGWTQLPKGCVLATSVQAVTASEGQPTDTTLIIMEEPDSPPMHLPSKTDAATQTDVVTSDAAVQWLADVHYPVTTDHIYTGQYELEFNKQVEEDSQSGSVHLQWWT